MTNTKANRDLFVMADDACPCGIVLTNWHGVDTENMQISQSLAKRILQLIEQEQIRCEFSWNKNPIHPVGLASSGHSLEQAQEKKELQ